MENDRTHAPLDLDYDPICGRLVVTSPKGGLLAFYGVPIEVYLGLRFTPTPEQYLRDRLIGHYAFVCTTEGWQQYQARRGHPH